MQTRDYIIATLVVVISILSILCYTLVIGYQPFAISIEPTTPSPTATLEPPHSSTPTTPPTQEPLRQETIPKPSAPEFTLKFVNSSFEVPPKYEVNEFTGEKVLVEDGRRIDNKSIQVIIKNQPFSRFTDNDVNEINFYYNVSWRGHYGSEWHTADCKYRSSETDYTVITVKPYVMLSTGDQLDFKVQAVIEYWTQGFDPMPAWPSYYKIWNSHASDWSSPQTITIP